MSRPGTLVAATSLALALAVPLGAPAGPAQAAPSPQASFVKRTHALVNAERRDHDVRTLGQNACLKKSAQRQARRMADRGELFHQDLGAVMEACGLSSAGENVAAGYPTPAATVRGWMGSPGHRANILRTSFRIAGVGAVKRDGRWWVAQVFGRGA